MKRQNLSSLEAGTVLTVTSPATHGDWKTAMVHSSRWPTLEAGTKVKFLHVYENYYGTWLAVLGPNGCRYDIEPEKVKL